MPVQKNLGKRCPYADECPLYQGNGIPENMDLTLWRNVFCNRGHKGWSNCEKFHEFERKEQ